MGGGTAIVILTLGIELLVIHIFEEAKKRMTGTNFDILVQFMK